MTITVRAPNGASVEFPDGTDAATIEGVMRESFGGPPQRKPAATVAETMGDMGMSALRGFNKQLTNIATAPFWMAQQEADRRLAAGEQSVTGLFPDKLPDALVGGGYMEPPKPQTTAGRYAGAVGEALGSSALPTAGLVTAAPRMAALAPTTLPRAVAQTVAAPIAARPGAAVALDAAAATGAGLGHQSAEDLGFGPAGKAIAGMVGGVAPVGLAAGVGRGVQAVQAARASADPYARVAKGLGDTHLDDVADSMAVGATRHDQAINSRVLATLGEEMVRANGNRQAAVTATLDRLVREGGVTPASAQDQLRRVVNAQRDSDLLFGEYPAVAASNADTRRRLAANVADEEAGALADTGTQRLIDYVANTGSMASSQNVRNAVGQRAAGLQQSTHDAVQALAPGGRTIQDVENLTASMVRQAQQEYDAVYNAPGGAAVNYPLLHRTVQRIAERHLNRMAGRGGEQADALRAALGELETTTAAGQRVIMPSLQMLQDMRGSIRGMITAADRAGRTHIVAALQPLYRDLTRAMQISSPQWARANQRWADMRLAEVAAELGDAFAKTAGPRFREQMREFHRLAPEAQDVVRIHFVQQLLDRIENASKLGGMKNLGELFTSQHTRNMIRTILGDDAAVQMARLVRDANVMARSRDMLRGSPTQPRQQMQKEQDADLNLLASAQNIDWQSWKSALMERAIAFMRERRNRVIGRVVTTPMRDTPAVAENLERMRRAQSRLELSRMPRPNPLAGVGGALGSIPAAYEE